MNKEGLLLKDEEIFKVVGGEWNSSHLRVAQAQLDKAIFLILQEIENLGKWKDGDGLILKHEMRDLKRKFGVEC